MEAVNWLEPAELDVFVDKAGEVLEISDGVEPATPDMVEDAEPKPMAKPKACDAQKFPFYLSFRNFVV